MAINFSQTAKTEKNNNEKSLCSAAWAGLGGCVRRESTHFLDVWRKIFCCRSGTCVYEFDKTEKSIKENFLHKKILCSMMKNFPSPFMPQQSEEKNFFGKARKISF